MVYQEIVCETYIWFIESEPGLNLFTKAFEDNLSIVVEILDNPSIHKSAILRNDIERNVPNMSM